MGKNEVFIHSTAIVDPKAKVGKGSKIWVGCQVRENASIGDDCILSKGVYVDAGVKIGDRVKIQNHVSIFHGVSIGDGVFVGPHVCFTNDRLPRAVNPDMSPKGASDWKVSPILVEAGASIGANSTVIPGVRIGKWSMVGAGSVVTKDVPPHALVAGNPARIIGWVCACGNRVPEGTANHRCKECPSP